MILTFRQQACGGIHNIQIWSKGLSNLKGRVQSPLA